MRRVVPAASCASVRADLGLSYTRASLVLVLGAGTGSTRRLFRHAALPLVGTAGTLAVRWAPTVAVGVARNGFAATALMLVFTTRLVGYRPGRVSGTVAVASRIEFVGFGLPLCAGRLADRYGVRSGLARFVMLPVLLVIAAVGGDHASNTRAI